MARIYKEVEFTVKGQKLTATASFEFVNKVEQRINLYVHVAQVQRGVFKITDIAWVIYCALVTAGHKVTYNEIGEDMQDSQEKMLAYMTSYGELIAECSPPTPITEEVKSGKENSPTQTEDVDGTSAIKS